VPSPAELDWARRVVVAAVGQGGAFRLDGRMVDPPVVALAQRTLARARPGR
jgi:citrate lyase subunit beta / citryl-CoA lyase